MHRSIRTNALRLPAVLLGGFLAAEALAQAHDWESLPPGPIRDRIELMEKVGENAKAINEAIKAGKPADAAAPADNIAALVPKIDDLFPEGSISEDSRAKPNIWAAWDEFQAFSTYLQEAATELAVTARDGGDVKAASRKMFKSCKSCHEKFRLPKEDE